MCGKQAAALDGGSAAQNSKLVARFKVCGETTFWARVPRRKRAAALLHFLMGLPYRDFGNAYYGYETTILWRNRTFASFGKKSTVKIFLITANVGNKIENDI